MPTSCNVCHACLGEIKIIHTEGEWCEKCQKSQYPKSHGYASSGEFEGGPCPTTWAILFHDAIMLGLRDVQAGRVTSWESVKAELGIDNEGGPSPIAQEREGDSNG